MEVDVWLKAVIFTIEIEVVIRHVFALLACRAGSQTFEGQTDDRRSSKVFCLRVCEMTGVVVTKKTGT